MDGFMGLVVLASSIWMAADASRLGYDRRDVRGLAGMGPVGWFFCGLLLWIVAFPLYLIKRPELKAAGEQRRRALAPGYGAPPVYGAPPIYGAPPVYGAPPQFGYGAGAYAPPAPPRNHDEVFAEIVKLDQLRVAGLLTDDEFQRKKSELLART